MKYKHISEPADGDVITLNEDSSLHRSRSRSFPSRGRRHRYRCQPGHAESGRGSGGKSLWRQTPDRVDADLRRREIDRDLRRKPMVAGRDAACVAQVCRLDKGAADDTDWRRHPLAECVDSPDARSVRLCAPDSLLHRRVDANERFRFGGHGRIPRKHRGHLRQGSNGQLARSR